MGTNKAAKKEYVILGAGGHAAVIADILYQCGCRLRGYLDDSVSPGTEVLDAIVLGKIESCMDYSGCLFIVGIGDNAIRKRIAEAYSLDYGRAIHPAAVIGSQVTIGSGSVVMAGSVINSRTVIGKHCIINTSSSIDHDNRLGDFVHVSPGAVLGGTVVVGERTHIGIGASVRNNIMVCNDVLVGVGAAVVKDIDDTGVYAGVPARKIS